MLTKVNIIDGKSVVTAINFDQDEYLQKILTESEVVEGIYLDSETSKYIDDIKSRIYGDDNAQNDDEEDNLDQFINIIDSDDSRYFGNVKVVFKHSAFDYGFEVSVFKMFKKSNSYSADDLLDKVTALEAAYLVMSISTLSVLSSILDVITHESGNINSLTDTGTPIALSNAVPFGEVYILN